MQTTSVSIQITVQNTKMLMLKKQISYVKALPTIVQTVNYVRSHNLANFLFKLNLLGLSQGKRHFALVTAYQSIYMVIGSLKYL